MPGKEVSKKVFEVNGGAGDQPTVYLKMKKSHIEEEGFILQIQDITDSVLQEQFKQENDTLTMLNACVSHELRNPLNSMIAQSVE